MLATPQQSAALFKLVHVAWWLPHLCISPNFCSAVAEEGRYAQQILAAELPADCKVVAAAHVQELSLQPAGCIADSTIQLQLASLQGSGCSTSTASHLACCAAGLGCPASVSHMQGDGNRGAAQRRARGQGVGGCADCSASPRERTAGQLPAPHDADGGLGLPCCPTRRSAVSCMMYIQRLRCRIKQRGVHFAFGRPHMPAVPAPLPSCEGILHTAGA